MRSRSRAVGAVRDVGPPDTRLFSSPHGATPRAQLLSNGCCTVMITAAGVGYSRWRDLSITEWRQVTPAAIYKLDAALRADTRRADA